MRRILIRVAGVALAGWLAVPGEAACAKLLVTESTVSGVAMNATFADDAIFDVPDGKKIRFLKKPENSTYEIDGPYRGTLADYRPKCGWWQRLQRQCGTQRDVEGGTRNITLSPPEGTKGVTTPKK